MGGTKGNINAQKWSQSDATALVSYAQILEDLNAAWSPHQGQIEVGKALFSDNKKLLVVQCGRKWGKTEFAVYALWLWALTHPKSECYYIAPELKQAKELIWSNFRLQSCNTCSNPDLVDHQKNLSKYIKTIRETDHRITFKNGSFIKVDGSDNYNAHRGTRPHFVVLDEAGFADPRFYRVMEPNLVVHKAPVLMISSPPEQDGFFMSMVEEAKIRPEGFYKKAPSWDNDRIPGLSEELEMKRKILTARGELDVFQREYGAEFIRGGSNAIFPMVVPSMMKDHKRLVESISLDRSKLDWYVIVDPGYVTCFAVLFAAYNPFTKQVYLLDTIHETEIKNMSDDQIWPRIVRKTQLLYPNSRLPKLSRLHEGEDCDWVIISDENPAGFRRNIPSIYGVHVKASGKRPLKKEEGLSIIKDQLISDKLLISSACEPLINEMTNYIRDENGNIPKRGDHLIDCLRYLNLAIGYSPNQCIPVKQSDDLLDRIRGKKSFVQDITEMRLEYTGHDLPEDWDYSDYEF